MMLEFINQFKYELTFIWISVCSLLTLLLCGSSNKKQQASNTSMLKVNSVAERPSGEATQTLTQSLVNKQLKIIEKLEKSPAVFAKRQERTSLKSKSLPSFPEPANPDFLLRQPCPDSRSGFSDFKNGVPIDKARATDGANVKQPDEKASLLAIKPDQIIRETGLKGEQKKAKEDRDYPVKPAAVKRGPTVLNAKISKHTMKQLERMLTSLDDVPKTKSTLKSSLKLAAMENVIKYLEGENFNEQEKIKEENKENFGDKRKDEVKVKDEGIGKDGNKGKDEYIEKEAGKGKYEAMEPFRGQETDERMGKWGNKGKDEDEMGNNVGMGKYGMKGKDDMGKEVRMRKYGSMAKVEVKIKDEFIRKDDFIKKDADKGKHEDMEKFGEKGRDERMGKYGNKGKVEDIGKDARMRKNEDISKNENMGKNEDVRKDVGIGKYARKRTDEEMGKNVGIAKNGGNRIEEYMGKHVGMGRYGGMKNDDIRKDERLKENEAIERNERMRNYDGMKINEGIRKNDRMGKNERMRKNEDMEKNEGMRKHEGMPKKGCKVKIEGKIRTMGNQEYRDR